jgi:uncharacterized protein YjbI with pentapeptide repeats
MANPEHVEILKQGVRAWNLWRNGHKDVRPDLGGADLTRINLTGVDFSGAVLAGANFTRAVLAGADLGGALLTRAVIGHADLSQADLTGADLGGAILLNANFREADLSHADLGDSLLMGIDFSYAVLGGADFTGASLGATTFADNGLSEVKGLETVNHFGPSSIGVDTIYKSQGKIPDAFLRGCGVPEDFITYMRSLTVQPIQFYSCFISYSHRDEEFARRLFSRMRDAGLRVWYAPEEMKGGRKLHEQIFSAIQLHDKLLLVLSENSLRSEWVMSEIRRARKAEREENRRKLFPIRLVDFDAIQRWECFNAESGKDLGIELREYFIPDFSDWKDHDAFEKAFDRLLRDLRAEGEGGG